MKRVWLSIDRLEPDDPRLRRFPVLPVFLRILERRDAEGMMGWLKTWEGKGVSVLLPGRRCLRLGIRSPWPT